MYNYNNYWNNNGGNPTNIDNTGYNPFDSNNQYNMYQNYQYYNQYYNQFYNQNYPCNCEQCQKWRENCTPNSQYSCNCEQCQNSNQNQYSQQQTDKKEDKKIDETTKEEQQKKNDVKTQYELSVEYENKIRQDEESKPLISEQKDIKILLTEYENNSDYLNSVQTIATKYHFIRKVRRDGNCFYRSFIYRLFEQICMKNNKELFEKIKKKIEESKELTERNGYQWIVVEDFYNLFYNEFIKCFNSLDYNITV